MMASLPQIGGFAESLRIVLKLNQIEQIRVFYAQKAASSLHHRERDKQPKAVTQCFPIL
ncbi:hypothetical protein [Pseudomonas sp. NPDC090201]|uniref:hypothetical protein n=1 Tax=Pseudomonas sp. NPDC090201 TaxID=3364475 RepID=UPI0037F3336E